LISAGTGSGTLGKRSAAGWLGNCWKIGISVYLHNGNAYVTIMIRTVEYEDEFGKNAFHDWFVRLEARAAAKVRTRVVRLEQGNSSHVDPVGEGVSECKIDYGPGYRIYFGRDGEDLVILLNGGHKKTQEDDIKTAKVLWKEYKLRKKKELRKCH
jgi:putative addiction module killer protein